MFTEYFYFFFFKEKYSIFPIIRFIYSINLRLVFILFKLNVFNSILRIKENFYIILKIFIIIKIIQIIYNKSFFMYKRQIFYRNKIIYIYKLFYLFMKFKCMNNLIRFFIKNYKNRDI